MKAVHFGGGNIGRGFIGLLLHESGYEVTFVDVNENLIRLFNELREYPVHIIGKDVSEVRWVRGVNAVHINDDVNLAKTLAGADVITTAVGKAALPYVAKALARAFPFARQDQLPMMIVACENLLGNSTYLQSLLDSELGDKKNSAAGLLVFPDCLVDRIVPNVANPEPGRHPLAVTVENYAQWVIDGTKIAKKPLIAGAEFSDGLESALAQKLFTVNLAHAIVAYYGYLGGYSFIHEALKDEHIRELTEGSLKEAGAALNRLYQIDSAAQEEFAKKTIIRLENEALQDSVLRVARDPLRKLGANDRLVRPALGALDAGIVPVHIATGVAAALSYDAATDKEAQELNKLIKTLGLPEALRKVTGVPHDHVLAELVKANINFRML